MCVVIDANTFAKVFNSDCADHAKFAPVKTWVMEGRGRIVYGGTKYKTELVNAPKYLKLFRLLKDSKRAFEVRQDLVDEREREILGLTAGSDCDDQHIIAIFCVSKCLLFCSSDSRAYPFIKDKRLYPKRHKRPAIYKSSRNSSLLCDRYIVPIQNLA